MAERTPLSSGFAIISILGLIIFFIFTIAHKIDKTWGFTMTLFFAICTVAAYYSIYPSDYKKKKKK